MFLEVSLQVPTSIWFYNRIRANPKLSDPKPEVRSQAISSSKDKGGLWQGACALLQDGLTQRCFSFLHPKSLVI